jgi:7-cyano-7-deazaguanine synthase
VSERVLLYSGGMDSVALDLLWPEHVNVYVDLGTGYSEAEKARLPTGTVVVPLPLTQWEREDKIIPLRNLMLVCVAAQYGDTVAMAATRGDRVLDKSQVFAEKTTDLLTYLWQNQHWTEGAVKSVVLPLKELTKAEIVAEVATRCGDAGVEVVARSFSCYTPVGDQECGACKPCYRKWVAFQVNGFGSLVVDATEYVVESILPEIVFGRFGRRRESLDVLRAFGVVEPENEAQAAADLLDKRGHHLHY